MSMNTEKMNLATISPAELIKAAETQAQKSKRVKTHQLRNIFGAVSKMRTKYQNSADGEAFATIEMDLVMLKPKLAYAAGRQKELKASLYQFMIDAINSILNAPEDKKKNALSNFFALMESLIAYHKFYGG